MVGKHRSWAFIVLPADERQYRGNVGYEDDPRRVYRYDSNVANHLQVSVGDVVVVRDRVHFLGVARVERIDSSPITKIRSSCPHCGTTDLKFRKTVSPPYRCVKGHLFAQPIDEPVDVTGYEAHYAKSFVPADDTVSVEKIKAAAFRPSDQMSIEEVDLGRLESDLLTNFPKTAALIAMFQQARVLDAKDGLEDSVSDSAGRYQPSLSDSRDAVLRAIKARRGQQRFRQSLIRRYGSRCMVSGCDLLDIVEAAHIWAYRSEGDNHPENGLLLRADLHTLFDLHLMTIEPVDLKVRLSSKARAAGYDHLEGKAIKIASKRRPSKEALEHRWAIFKQAETDSTEAQPD